MGQLQDGSTTGTAPRTWTARSSRPWTRLRCPPPDADVTRLSQAVSGAGSRCAGLLLSQPDLLLLDQPTDGTLDAESVLWLEPRLEKCPGTVVAVAHDGTSWMTWPSGSSSSTVAAPAPTRPVCSTYLETKAARLKIEGAKAPKSARRLEDGLEWLTPPARRARQAKPGPARALRGVAAEADENRQTGVRGDPGCPPGPRLGDVVP